MAPRNQRSIESGTVSGAKSQGREAESEKGDGSKAVGALNRAALGASPPTDPACHMCACQVERPTAKGPQPPCRKYALLGGRPGHLPTTPTQKSPVASGPNRQEWGAQGSGKGLISLGMVGNVISPLCASIFPSALCKEGRAESASLLVCGHCSL